MRTPSRATPPLESGDLRAVLSEAYDGLSEEGRDEVVGRVFGSDDPEELAEFLSALGKVAGHVAKALPAVLPVVGTAIGGPLGGAIGAAGGVALGGALAAAGKGKAKKSKGGRARRAVGKPAAAKRVAAKPPAPRVVLSRAQVRGAEPVLALPPGPPAAAQLLGLFFRPELLQALVALVAGRAGRGTVPVGPAPAAVAVPALSLLELLGVLAAKAADQQREALAFEAERTPEHLLDADGEARCDLGAPEERAEVLWELLCAADRAEVEAEAEEDADDAGEAEAWDPWELAAAMELEDLYEGLDEDA